MDRAVNQFAEKIASLCKPPGSLGQIERLALELCRIQQTANPQTRPRHVTIFAADHGIATEGVTAWPQSVTASVVKLMTKRKTASGVFATELQATYEVVDVGLLQPIAELEAKQDPNNSSTVRRATSNSRFGPAMTLDEFERAWQVGSSRAHHAAEQNHVLIGGEMGIGNTTSASCLACLLANIEPMQAVGRGAGVDDAGLNRKREVVAEVVRRVRAAGISDPKRIACEVGGFEIVALAGFYATAASRGRTILLDGFIATTAALLAERIYPGTKQFMIAGHRSAEQAHAALLEYLGLEPLLDLGCRLGEASGALLALPLLDLAVAMINEMATLHDLEQ